MRYKIRIFVSLTAETVFTVSKRTSYRFGTAKNVVTGGNTYAFVGKKSNHHAPLHARIVYWPFS